jgi:hypothetical protein
MASVQSKHTANPASIVCCHILLFTAAMILPTEYRLVWYKLPILWRGEMPNNNSMEESKCFVCGEKIPLHDACFWTASCCQHEDFLKYFAKLKQQHTDLQAKHDELRELVRGYFEALDKIKAGYMGNYDKTRKEFIAHAPIFRNAEAALRKAVEGE